MKLNIYIERAKKHIQAVGQKTASVTIKGKKHTFYPAKTAAIIIGIIVAVSVFASIIVTGIGTHSVDISFESGSPYRVHQLEKNVMLYNNRGAVAVNSKGKTVWEIEAPLSSPLAESDGDYVLLCDLAGNHYASIYKNGNQVMEYSLDNDIISAKVTDKGYAAFATDTDGYKGKVTVFNKRGREMYVWNSGGGYITDIELTDNGRYLVAAQLIGEGEEVSSRIQFIDTGKGEAVSAIERNGEVVVNVKFITDNKLIAVTDSNILGYNKKGKELFCISLTGKSPSLYSIDSDEIIAVATLDNRGNSAIEIYSMSGKLCGSYTAEGTIRAMTAIDKRVLVAEQRGLVTLNLRGKVKNIVKQEHDISDIGSFSGGRAITVGTSSAETLSID